VRVKPLAPSNAAVQQPEGIVHVEFRI